jgi:hypothetical protein
VAKGGFVMKLRPMPSRERLDELLIFNKITGDITRKISVGGQKAGSLAGTIMIDKRNGRKIRMISIDSLTYQAHRLMWFYVTGQEPKEIDHKNGNSLDNRYANLRPANRNLNTNNAAMQKNNTSGVIGVYRHSDGHGWMAVYGSNEFRKKHGTQKYFEDFFEAVCCRKSWECKLGMAELKKHRKD